MVSKGKNIHMSMNMRILRTRKVLDLVDKDIFEYSEGDLSIFIFASGLTIILCFHQKDLTFY